MGGLQGRRSRGPGSGAAGRSCLWRCGLLRLRSRADSAGHRPTPGRPVLAPAAEPCCRDSLLCAPPPVAHPGLAPPTRTESELALALLRPWGRLPPRGPGWPLPEDGAAAGKGSFCKAAPRRSRQRWVAGRVRTHRASAEPSRRVPGPPLLRTVVAHRLVGLCDSRFPACKSEHSGARPVGLGEHWS